MDGKGMFVIRRLFKAYLSNPRQLHDNTIISIFKIFDSEKYKHVTSADKSELGRLRNEVDAVITKSSIKFQLSLLRAICDHISGMTDRFAMSEHERLYSS